MHSYSKAVYHVYQEGLALCKPGHFVSFSAATGTLGWLTAGNLGMFSDMLGLDGGCISVATTLCLAQVVSATERAMSAQPSQIPTLESGYRF